MTRKQFILQVKNHEKSFRRFLMALCCGDSPLADDIAQESYLKAYVSLAKLENPESFRYWLFRIAHNTFLSHKRCEKPTEDYENAYGISSDSESDVSFRYQDLHQALDRLPIKVRTSIILYYMEGYSVRETADIIDSTEEAVRQHLARGRKHLKELLENNGYGRR
ncbi:MAG: RNA polymerase sigma factor [Muribaculaceae bacterium]|nr:RNA polymerase sigma factor [Muribaculaceae bacterium]